LWGQEIPEAFDTLKDRYGSKSEVGVSAIGPAGERQAHIASVMNDRYHAFGRQGFGAIYGSKNLKAIVVGGKGEVPIADEKTFKSICKGITKEYQKDLGLFMRFVVWFSATRKWMSWLYRLFPRLGMKIAAPTPAMRQMWSKRG